MLYCLRDLFVSCHNPREVTFFPTLSWVFSGTDNDPEVALERLCGCPRSHSTVPCRGGRWLLARLTQAGHPHTDPLQFQAGKPCSVRING